MFLRQLKKQKVLKQFLASVFLFYFFFHFKKFYLSNKKINETLAIVEILQINFGLIINSWKLQVYLSMYHNFQCP